MDAELDGPRAGVGEGDGRLDLRYFAVVENQRFRLDENNITVDNEVCILTSQPSPLPPFSLPPLPLFIPGAPSPPLND